MPCTSDAEPARPGTRHRPVRPDSPFAAAVAHAIGQQQRHGEQTQMRMRIAARRPGALGDSLGQGGRLGPRLGRKVHPRLPPGARRALCGRIFAPPAKVARGRSGRRPPCVIGWLNGGRRCARRRWRFPCRCWCRRRCSRPLRHRRRRRHRQGLRHHAPRGFRRQQVHEEFDLLRTRQRRRTFTGGPPQPPRPQRMPSANHTCGPPGDPARTWRGRRGSRRAHHKRKHHGSSNERSHQSAHLAADEPLAARSRVKICEDV